MAKRVVEKQLLKKLEDNHGLVASALDNSGGGYFQPKGHAVTPMYLSYAKIKKLAALKRP